MESQLTTLEQKAYWHLQRLRRVRPSQDMMPEGVTPGEMLALKITADFIDQGEFPRPGMLAARMRVTKSALSQTLRPLEDKGLITRSRDKQDSRAVLLELTDRGRDVIAEAEAKRIADTHQLVEYIGVEDMEHLVVLLDKVASYMEAHGDIVEAGSPVAAQTSREEG